jgi:hypothetical protein
MTTSTMTTAPLPPSIEIHVTLTDIRDGRPCEPKTCPIALAILNKLADAGYVPISISVGGHHAYIDIPHTGGSGMTVYHYNLPPEASRFVRDFDGDMSPEPFSFVMTLHDSYVPEF